MSSDSSLGSYRRYNQSKMYKPTTLIENMAEISKEQSKFFTELSSHFSLLEVSLSKSQEKISSLQLKLREISELKEKYAISTLKVNQSEFIISELQQKVNKQIKKQEKMYEEIIELKKRSENYKEDLFQLESVNKSQIDKISGLEFNLRQKSKKYQEVVDKFRRYQKQTKSKEIRDSSQSHGKRQDKNAEYIQLEQKLEDLERQFSNELQKYSLKNEKLEIQLKKIQEKLHEEKEEKLKFRNLVEKMNMNKYEFELKQKQQNSIYLDLEETYNNLLQKSTANQINFHQQIHNSKLAQVEEKNNAKKQRKQIRQSIQNLANCIVTSGKHYFITNQIKQQLQEIKVLITKENKRKNQNALRQSLYLKDEIEILKKNIEEKIKKNQELEAKQISNIIVVKEEKQKMERVSQNGSFLNNKSEKSQSNDERYKIKIQQLRKQIKSKQKTINQMEQAQQQQFEKLKEKILQNQFQLSEKINQCKKLELKLKDKDSEIQNFENLVKQSQKKLVTLNEKIEKQKEIQLKSIQLKTQTFEEKIKLLKINYRQLEKKEQEKILKYNKLKARYQKIEVETTESLKRKTAQIDELLKECNRLKMENKILTEKINLNHILSNEQSNQNNQLSTEKGINNDLIEQIQMERDRILQQYHEKSKQFMFLEEKFKNTVDLLENSKKQNKEKILEISLLQKQKKNMVEDSENVKLKLSQLINQNQRKSEEEYAYFKKELQKSIGNVKKLEKQIQKYKEEKEENKKKFQQIKQENISLKLQAQKNKEKFSQHLENLNEQKLSTKKLTQDFERKISQCTVREQQLIEIINYKNRQNGNQLRQSMTGEVEKNHIMVGTDEEIIKKTKQKSIQTNASTSLVNQSMNTEYVSEYPKNLQEQFFQQGQSSEINQYNLMEKNIEDFYVDKEYQKKEEIEEDKHYEVKSNLFENLQMENDNIDQHFQICEEGESINIGQTAINLQIKEIFTKLRVEIEKIFNEEDIEYSMMKILPKQLEDDYSEFISYLKEKIYDIKQENNLSFIMAEAGEEPSLYEDVGYQIQVFLKMKSYDSRILQKIIQEKEILITSLMAEKTQQENTINQMAEEREENQEENQNRFMNQCNIYKKEVKEHKKHIDALEMNFDSLRKIYQKTMEIWIAEEQNIDDFKDNLKLYSSIAKLTEKEKARFNFYLKRYMEIRGFSEQ